MDLKSVCETLPHFIRATARYPLAQLRGAATSIMVNSRSLLLSFLSLTCVGIFLYYVISPEGPRLLHWQQWSNVASSAKEGSTAVSSVGADVWNPFSTDTEVFNPT